MSAERTSQWGKCICNIEPCHHGSAALYYPPFHGYRDYALKFHDRNTCRVDITAWMTFYSVSLSELSTKTKGDMRFQGMAVRPHCQEGSQSNAESLRNNAEAARGITPASLSNITDVSVMVKRDLMPPDAAYTIHSVLRRETEPTRQ